MGKRGEGVVKVKVKGGGLKLGAGSWEGEGVVKVRGGSERMTEWLLDD